MLDRRYLHRLIGAALAALAVIAAAGLLVLGGGQAGADAAANRPSGPLVPESGTLFGIYIDVGGAFTDAEVRAGLLDLEADIGRKVDIAHDFQPFDNAINVGRLKWYHANGRIPMATWNGAPYGEILSGENDAWIRSQANKFKNVGAPVFLRFFHEVDAQKGINWGYEAKPWKYEEVWRYVHDIFDEEGAHNVVWVYAPTAWGFETGEAGLYYPGNDVVDWIGSDGYLYVPCRAGDEYESFESVYEASVDFAAAKNKPLMAAEWGVGGSGDDAHKVDFIESALQAAQDNPELAAIVYFNKPDGPDGCNWSLDTTPAALAAFAELGQQPHFNQPSGPTSQLCRGYPPTHWGTEGPDVITGTGKDDVIVGHGGSDLIYGKAGSDLICANGGNDIVYGGLDKDDIYGGAGKDDLYGNEGGDTLHGGDRADLLKGGAWNDTLFGNRGNDELRGSTGNDGLKGGKGDKDDCYGGTSGGDYVIGSCEFVSGVP